MRIIWKQIMLQLHYQNEFTLLIFPALLEFVLKEGIFWKALVLESPFFNFTAVSLALGVLFIPFRFKISILFDNGESTWMSTMCDGINVVTLKIRKYNTIDKDISTSTIKHFFSATIIIWNRRLNINIIFKMSLIISINFKETNTSSNYTLIYTTCIDEYLITLAKNCDDLKVDAKLMQSYKMFYGIDAKDYSFNEPIIKH